MATDIIGKPKNRVDGKIKVTGEAKYAAEFNAPNLLYGAVLNSTIAKGSIENIDTSAAMKLKGVVTVLTHLNRTDLAYYDSAYQDMDAPPGSPFRPLFDNKIQFNMQPIALVVAETQELAQYATNLIQVTYEQEAHVTDFEKQMAQAYKPESYKAVPPPEPWGHPEAMINKLPHRVNATYTHPSMHHNPIEMHASTVYWEGEGKVTVYDKIQGAINSQEYLIEVFDLKQEDVSVLSPYVGGAFGSGLRPQYQLFLAAMAALELRRSVKLVLSRPQMFSFGHRPKTVQNVSLGADADGTLQAIIHEVYGETSSFEDYSENVVIWPAILYNCDHVKLNHKLVALDAYTPLDTRAPGGVTGIFALESAVDELAYRIGIDPLDFRLQNYSQIDQIEGKPFSSKELRECFRQGAEKFGWSKRKPEPRSMKKGNQLIGWGVATGAWEAKQKPASAKAVLTKDGELTVSSATGEIGTGTYTIMSQLAAETLGIKLENVTFLLGDSSLPKAPMQGGSATASSVGSAVFEVCQALGRKLYDLAKEIEGSPLKDLAFPDVEFTDGHIRSRSENVKTVSIAEVLTQSKSESLEAEIDATPHDIQDKYAVYAHSAVFAEVMVDKDLGTVKVTRLVSAIAGGRILNAKTAESQILGGMVWGIGMALEEHAVMDHEYGRFINHDLSKYHVPVNADIQELEVIFVAEQDDIVNPIGAKGLGEIGIVGVPPAIANAVYHATGKRVRDLPITLDKLM